MAVEQQQSYNIGRGLDESRVTSNESSGSESDVSTVCCFYSCPRLGPGLGLRPRAKAWMTHSADGPESHPIRQKMETCVTATSISAELLAILACFVSFLMRFIFSLF